MIPICLYLCPAAAGVMGDIIDAVGKVSLGSAPIIRLASVVEASQNDSRDFYEFTNIVFFSFISPVRRKENDIWIRF